MWKPTKLAPITVSVWIIIIACALSPQSIQNLPATQQRSLERAAIEQDPCVCHQHFDNEPLFIFGDQVFYKDENGSLYAVDATSGKPAYRLYREQQEDRQPFVFGTLARFADSGGVYVFDVKSGTLMRRFRVWDDCIESRIVDNGRLYVWSRQYDPNNLYAMDLNRWRKKWAVRIDNNLTKCYGVAGRLVLYGTSDGLLHAVDTLTNRKEWKLKIADQSFEMTAIQEGVACLVSDDGALLGVDIATGEQLWSFRPQVPVANPFVFDRQILFESEGQVCCLDLRSGEAIWSLMTPGGMASKPAVAGNLVLLPLHGDTEDRLVALDSGTGKMEWEFTSPVIRSDPVVDRDRVYIVADSRVMALDLSTGVAVAQTSEIEGDYQASFSMAMAVRDEIVCLKSSESLCALHVGESGRLWQLDLWQPDPINLLFTDPQYQQEEALRVRASPTEAKRLVGALARQVLVALKNQDVVTLASLVHPDRGVQFSLYRFISVEEEPVFTAEQFAREFDINRRIFWRTEDGTGDRIRLSVRDYLRWYIYDYDFLKAPQVGYNNLLSGGTTMVSNIDSIYHDALFVSYHFPGTNVLLWQSLHLAFEEKNGRWYLTGVIRDFWTI